MVAHKSKGNYLRGSSEVERWSVKPVVEGSNPSRAANKRTKDGIKTAGKEIIKNKKKIQEHTIKLIK